MTLNAVRELIPKNFLLSRKLFQAILNIVRLHILRQSINDSIKNSINDSFYIGLNLGNCKQNK